MVLELMNLCFYQVLYRFFELLSLYSLEKKEGDVHLLQVRYRFLGLISLHLLRRGGGGEKMPKGGIEPPTRGFSVHCSAD